jgi:choline kinase
MSAHVVLRLAAMTPAARDSAPELGLILAAGLGSRLEAAKGSSRLKPLLPVLGEPLIVRVIRGMERAGCRRVLVVTGFLVDELEGELKQAYDGPVDLGFVRNPDFQKANGLSVLAAEAELDAPFLLSMSDHLLGDDLMTLAKNHQPLAGGAALLVDYKVESVFDLDDATKVRAEGSRLVDIGKQLSNYDCIDTGLFVGTRGLVEALATVRAERGDASLSEGVARLAADGRMEVLDIGEGFWADVDTPEMLANAEARLRP